MSAAVVCCVLQQMFQLICRRLYAAFVDFTENFGGSRQRARNEFNGSQDELHSSVADSARARLNVFHHEVTRQQEGGIDVVFCVVLMSFLLIYLSVLLAAQSPQQLLVTEENMIVLFLKSFLCMCHLHYMPRMSSGAL